jgi:AcrR family transcriptional regulator
VIYFTRLGISLLLAECSFEALRYRFDMARQLSQEAREAALHSARQLLACGGLDGLRFEAVARASGVAKSTLYRHWPTRGDLILATLFSMIEPLEIPNTGGLHSDLVACFGKAIDIDSADSAQLVHLIFGPSVDEPEMGRVREMLFFEQTQPIRVAIESAIRRGELRAEIDVEMAVSCAIGPAFVASVLRQQVLTAAQVEELVAVAEASLRALGTLEQV